jgi:hypothetical protein
VIEVGFFARRFQFQFQFQFQSQTQAKVALEFALGVW